MPTEETIFSKLGEIPVLNDGWTTALSCYSKVKDFNNLTKFTLNVAESGIKKAVEITSPVVHSYKSQIDCVNEFACNKLEDIETKYPLIKQPTNEIKDVCLDYVQPVVGRVKPVVTYARDVVVSGKKKVDRIKKCSSNLVAGACDMGVGTMTRAVTLTLDTPPGRFVTKTVDGVLSCADGIVDYYIPNQEPVVRDGDNNGVERIQPEQMMAMDPSPERVIVHFKTVSNKLRQRMFQKAMRDFQGAKLRTMEAVGKLHSTVDLIEYAKNNLNTARDKVEDLWGKITEDVEEASAKQKDTGPVEQRIVTFGRLLVDTVKNGIITLEKTSAEVGQFIRHPISKSAEYKQFVSQFSSDISTFSVKKAKESLQYIQKRLSQMVDNMESSDWLTVDIDMDDIELKDDDVSLSRLDDADFSCEAGCERKDDPSHHQPEEEHSHLADEMVMSSDEFHSPDQSKSENFNSGQESEDGEDKE